MPVKSLRPVLIFLLVILSMGLFIGCGNQNKEDNEPKETTATIKVFYGENNEKMVTEERKITYGKDENKYIKTLEELIKGPENKDYIANLNKDTKIYGTIKQNSDLIIDFSEDFAQFDGSMGETIGVASVVNTITQFDEIKRVKILVEGEELMGPSGEPRGFMETFPLQLDISEDMEVTLYFSNDQADKVVAEKREIPTNPDQDEFIKSVLEELIKGPQDSKLSATIPKTVKIQSVAIANGLAKIDFSKEMESDHWGGAAGESMTLNSLVNTLTEFDYIDKVQMTVEGKPMNIEHMVLEEPAERNEDIIQK